MESKGTGAKSPREAEDLAKEQARKKACFAREQSIEEAQKAAKAGRAGKRTAEAAEQLAKEQKRKVAWLAQEQAISEAEIVRKSKEAKRDEAR